MSRARLGRWLLFRRCKPPPGLRRTFGLAAGTTATVAVGVLIHAEANSGFSPYDKARWLLAIAVGIAGLVCLTQPRWARYAVIVGSIAAGQLATSGMFAMKRWEPLNGMSNVHGSVPRLRIAAAGLAFLGVVTLLVGLACAVKMAARQTTRTRCWAVAVGILVAVGIPFLGYGVVAVVVGVLLLAPAALGFNATSKWLVHD